MASSAKGSSLFFLVTLLLALHIHARDSQLFNKISTSNKESPTLNKQEPNFLPDNEESYGLYGHETAQLPPSTTTTATTNPLGEESHKQPLNRYLPKNYNPVSYITEPDPDDIVVDNAVANDNDNRKYSYGDARRSYQRGEEEGEYRSFPTNMNYNNLGSSFNSEPHGVKENGFDQPQGMSDTRSLENGKYYYDVQTEKYNVNHPYELLKRLEMSRNAYGNSRNYYHSSNADNAEEFKFNNENYDGVGGYDENQAEFHNEESDATP